MPDSVKFASIYAGGMATPVGGGNKIGSGWSFFHNDDLKQSVVNGGLGTPLGAAVKVFMNPLEIDGWDGTTLTCHSVDEGGVRVDFSVSKTAYKVRWSGKAWDCTPPTTFNVR